MRIDPHCHLGGSYSIDFVWYAIQKFNLKHLASSIDDVQRQMTFGPNEPRTFNGFLDKFKILDNITWTKELIDHSIKFRKL